MPQRAEGFLNDKNKRIIFYHEQERKEMTFFSRPDRKRFLSEENRIRESAVMNEYIEKGVF